MIRRLNVVAGILFDSDNRVLISERTDEGPFTGLWEFPGGKIDPDESPVAALQRELAEEIGVNVSHADSFMELQHDYPDRSVSLQFFRIKSWQGVPSGLEGQRLRWLKPADIDIGEMLPADAPVIEALCREP